MGIMATVTEILVATFPSYSNEGLYHHGLIAQNFEAIFLLYQELKLQILYLLCNKNCRVIYTSFVLQMANYRGL